MLWNERTPKLEEERRYQRLLELHQLTQAWLNELGTAETKTDSYRLERTARPELSQTLWLLEKIKLDQLPPRLSEMVGGTSVTEFLDTLHETILIVQLSTLENILENSADRMSSMNVLEQVSWNYAKALAEKAWRGTHFHSPKDTFHALETCALNDSKAFLLESWNQRELCFFWLGSPLGKTSLNRSPFIRELASLQLEFLRGYFYGLSRHYRLEMSPTILNQLHTYRICVTANDSH